MSSRCMFMKSGWITANAPLRNGLGRFMPQLARMTLKFCKNDGGSHGVRQFIQQDVVQFAKENPSCVVYLKPRRHRSPVLVAEYLNGERHWHSLHNNGTIESASNHAIVRFKTDSRWTCSSCKFSIQVNTSVEGNQMCIDI